MSPRPRKPAYCIVKSVKFVYFLASDDIALPMDCSGTPVHNIATIQLQVSATLLRGLEGIRHLLLSLAERAKDLEEEVGDPAKLARSIVADDITARVRWFWDDERVP